MMKKERIIASVMGAMAPLLGVSCNDGKPDNPQDLEGLLQQLERSRTPTRKLQMGAMCYSVAMPGDIEYVCPKCHERTLYAVPKHRENMTEEEKEAYNNQHDDLWKIGELMEYRRAFAKLPSKADAYNLELELDESAFCSHCSETDERDFFLTVRQPDGTVHRTKLSSYSDLLILNAFFEKRDVWIIADNERLLKPEAPRIRELLGIGAQKEAAVDDE